MSTVTKPILKDETFTSKMDSLIACFSGHTLTIHASASDSISFSGQEVKIKNMATGTIAATVYVSSATDTTVNLPDGFNYGVIPVVTLTNHYCEDKPSGLLTTNTTVNLTYQSLGNVSTFTGLKAAIDAGHGGLIQLGQEVTYTGDTTNEPIFECVDWDSENNRMTLLMKHIMVTDRQFDAPEALYQAPVGGLAAGDYSFINGSTYYFTLTRSIPAGGQLVASTSAFTTYSTKGGTTAIESGSVSTTAIEGATSLGTCGTGLLNDFTRCSVGSNDYGESAIRQWLNASGSNWWQAKTMFDRPCDFVGTNGFMTGISQTVLDAVDTTAVPCASQNSYCAPDSSHSKNSQYTCNDKFYLASQKEIYGSTEFEDNSKQFAAYVGLTDAQRKKYYQNTSSNHWWLRSPDSGAGGVRCVTNGGSIGGLGVNYSYGVVVACKISKSSI